MPDDDELGADPAKTENRSWPDGRKSGGDPFEESRREHVEKGEREERPPERPRDRDED